MSTRINNSDLPSFDDDDEEPYPEGQREAATIQWALKAHRDAEAAIEQQLSIVREPFNEETGEVASYFDRVWTSANIRYLGSPPPFLSFEKRGHYWEDDVGWADVPTVKVPRDYTTHRLPRVLKTSAFSCQLCGFITKRADWFRDHIREKHPKIEGPITRGCYRKYADTVDAETAESGPISTNITDFVNNDTTSTTDGKGAVEE